MTGAARVRRSLPDGDACGIKGIGAQVHFVAVVVAIAVGIRAVRVCADDGFVGIREPVISRALP